MTIKIKSSHKGKLHKALGVPAGQPIPLSKEEKAARSKNPTLRREAQFAINARKFKHK
jgi:hypothetical protein